MPKGALTVAYPAVYMLIRQDGKLAFVLRSNTGFMDGYYSLPAGRVEPAEAFRPAAIREAAEEAGVTVLPEHAKHVFTHHRYATPKDIWVDVYFEAVQWSGTPVNAAPEEHGELAWFAIADLPEGKIMPYQYAALQGIAKGETYGEFNWPKEA
ncbi:MAG TPA: NUDIX domain-containing protein [Candidatus Saccharimonadales bacterium]